MPHYDDFSVCYDSLMSDADYSARAKRVLDLFDSYDRRPTLLLDLACGTGAFSYELADKGIDVIGVDCSDGMLAAATQKLPQGATNPLFLNQCAEELELFGTVDGAICMMDSLNHITEYENFKKALGRVSLFLEKDRLFIFDVNTPYKHEQVLGNNTFVKEDESTFCVWQNEYEGNGLTNIYLDLFVNTNDENYQRYYEEFSERAYSADQIKAALTDAGLEVVATFDDMTQNPPTEKSERITYIVRKK